MALSGVSTSAEAIEVLSEAAEAAGNACVCVCPAGIGPALALGFGAGLALATMKAAFYGVVLIKEKLNPIKQDKKAKAKSKEMLAQSAAGEDGLKRTGERKCVK